MICEKKVSCRSDLISRGKKLLQGGGGIAAFVGDNMSLQWAGKILDISVFPYILL